MPLELWVIGLLCIAYFVAGFVDSIAGAGGLICIPAFLLTGLAPETVIATNKVAVSSGMLAAFTTYWRNGFVHWRVLAVGFPCAFLGGILGSRTLLYFDSATIGKIIVFLLPLGIFATLMPRKKKPENQPISRRNLYIFIPLICMVIGFYDGFFGPGSGSFLILALYGLLGLGLIQASGSAKALNLASCLSSFFVYWWNGKILFTIGIPLIFANVAGNIVGSKLAIRIGAEFVRRMLIFVLVLLFVSLIWKFFL